MDDNSSQSVDSDQMAADVRDAQLGKGLDIYDTEKLQAQLEAIRTDFKEKYRGKKAGWSERLQASRLVINQHLTDASLS